MDCLQFQIQTPPPGRQVQGHGGMVQRVGSSEEDQRGEMSSPASCSHGSAGNGCPLWFSVSWVPGWSLPCVLNVLHVPRADKDLFHTSYTIVDLLKSLTKTWSAALTAGSHSFPICFGRNRFSLNDSNKVLCDNCGRGWPCLGPCASRWIHITWNNALVGLRKLGFKVLLVICDIQIAFNLNSETDVQDGGGKGRHPGNNSWEPCSS